MVPPTLLLIGCVVSQMSTASETDRLWAYQFGVAGITSNAEFEIFSGDVNISDGAAGGQIYSFTASRFLGELEWRLGDFVFHPQMELPLTLEIVDENSRSPFPDYNAAFMMRWVDFPWNETIVTTLGMGIGISYSSKILLMDQQRHPESDRSHLKFDMPLQLTFALPSHPEHQLLFYLVHQSGGRVFDQGGVNSLGIGYRLGF
jgi:hypothetical protein